MEHHKLSVGGPTRTLVLPGVGQQAFAAAARAHHADAEGATANPGEGNEVAARAPCRRSIVSASKADPALVRSVIVHDVKLLAARSVAFEYDPVAVGREAGRRVRTRGRGQPA